MRAFASLCAALVVLLASAAPAFAISNAFKTSFKAAPVKIARIEVKVSDKVRSEPKRWGPEDIAYLKKELVKKTRRALQAKDLMDAKNGALLVLTLEDVTPNRPTMRALQQRRHLDFISSGLGGAKISARLSGPGGEALGQAHGQWSETQLDELTIDNGTWFDARRAFDWFARHLAKALRAKEQS